MLLSLYTARTTLVCPTVRTFQRHFNFNVIRIAKILCITIHVTNINEILKIFSFLDFGDLLTL